MDRLSADLSPLECCLHASPSPRNMPNFDQEARDGERAVWEYHTVPINRVPGYGFGIAVSGGRDNPHFTNGDPAIAISDVLKAGPAEGRLLINDRVISANGTSLENVEYAKAVQVLRDSASPIHLLIKRRVVLPGPQQDYHTLRITLTKNKKKDDFGIVLGCKLFIKEITNKNVIGKDASGVAEGDIITKINNATTDSLTLKEAKKLIENCKEKLQLVVRRETTKNTNENTQNVYDNTMAPTKNDVNNMHSFSDVNEMRNYSNQNLYVQPPIRGDKYRSPPPPPEDKNNLTRMSGRSRGPLMDISLSQLDQPATPLLQGHNHNRPRVIPEEDDPPPRPPPPHYDGNLNQPSTPLSQELYDDDPLSRRGKLPLPDPRFISFLKEGSVGIRLTGGNQTGIFVTAVQPGSPASLQGLQPGDKILKVNNFDMKDVTREEAVLYLLNLQDRIDLIVQYRREEYDSIVASQAGDSFYVRTHFNYDNVNKSELSFRIGDVFHVVDTLYNGVVGSWQVYRIGRNNQQTQKGIIPNKNRAEELAVERANSAKKESFSESRGSFFKRRSARRTKILMDSASKFPSYERITLRHPGFTRPVILLGPLSDAARDKLLKDSPAKYVSPQLDNHLDDSPKSKSAVIVRLSAIKEISERGKHAVVDITPNAVDRLNYAQFYPIVIFMRADNKHVIKDLRSRLSKSGKSSKKLFDHMVKLEKTWSHIFTATVTLTSADTWYKKIKEVIEMQQQQPIWISETKPEEPITDDFLFPMTSRLSYASSPESDLDLATDINHRTTNELTTPSYGDRRLVKASSDPSIATQEDIGLPSYHGPPPYNEFDNCPYPSQPPAGDQKRVDAGTEEQFYSKYYSSNENRNSISQHAAEPRHKFNAYNSRPVSDTYSERTNGDPMDPYSTKSRSPPKVPPKIDRGSKPFHLRSAHERLFGLNDNVEPNVGAGNYINATQKSPEKPYSYQNSCETLSYGSDSYGKLPVGLPDDAKARELQLRMLHDPYRYTRSTSQPIRNKMLELNAQPKYSSRNDYKPVPPPKPKNYRSPNSGLPAENYWNREDEMARNKLMYDIAKPDGGRSNNYNENDYAMRPATNYYAGKSYGLNDHNTISERLVNGGMKTRCDSDSAGFDSGQGSSLDRNYDTTHKTASPSRRGGGGGYYYNVPPPREVAHHHRDASGLDLSNRENRGSAFELYKKPNSLHGFSPLTVNVDTLKSTEKAVESSSSCSSSSTSTSEDSQDGNVQEDNVILGSGRGKFGIEGGKIVCSKTGVCLVIPPGALPPNSEQEIFLKVCQDNKLLPPLDKDKGEKLLSPLVMCGPHGVNFSKPVELRLPHCATKNQEDWSFALKISETPTGNQSKWQNLSLDKESQQWRVDGDYVILLVDHF